MDVSIIFTSLLVLYRGPLSQLKPMTERRWNSVAEFMLVFCPRIKWRRDASQNWSQLRNRKNRTKYFGLYPNKMLIKTERISWRKLSE